MEKLRRGGGLQGFEFTALTLHEIPSTAGGAERSSHVWKLCPLLFKKLSKCLPLVQKGQPIFSVVSSKGFPEHGFASCDSAYFADGH